MSEMRKVLLVFLWIIGFFPQTWAIWIQWIHEHELCTSTMEMEKGVILKNPPIVNCVKANYIYYFEKIIQYPPSSYHKLIAETVLNLYTDLQKRKKPMAVTIHRQGQETSIDVYPISFCIPEENIVSTVPPKMNSFGRVIPGVQSTYYHLYNESQYFQDMQRSLFVLTYKKGGWDCLRHYEILAAGALPLFPDIAECPDQTLTLHPKVLYKLLLQLPALELEGKRSGRMTMEFTKLEVDNTKLDPDLYSATVQAMLQYTRNVLSTKAMAKYVLDTMYANSKGKLKANLPQKLFYLSHQDRDMDKGDYMTDFLLHGLIQLLGQPVVTDFPSRDCLYKTTNEFNETNYLERRLKLYGAGFSWGLKLDHLSKDIHRHRQEIHQNIIHRRYDVIILGSGHRDGWASKLHYWDLICKHYDPLEVGYVDGADYHLRKKTLEKYSICAGHIFSREGYVL